MPILSGIFGKKPPIQNSMELSEKQILALAPDEASIKAGKQLSSAVHWVSVGANSRALWGECRGSGPSPYQTQVDLEEMAFKCTCPSRKFPCKHSLGLMLLFVGSSATDNPEPDWVGDWLSGRREKTEKKPIQSEKSVGQVARAKRVAQKNVRVLEGIAEMRSWLKDQISVGVADLPAQSYYFWQNLSKRLIDAQAPGLSNLVVQMGQYDYHGDDWPYLLIRQILRLHLIGRAYENLEEQDPAMQQEIRTWVGFSTPKADVLAQKGLVDRWFVLSRRTELVERLVTDETWLWGESCDRIGLLLQYYSPEKQPEQQIVSHTVLEGELCFYPGKGYRALFASPPVLSSVKYEGIPTCMAGLEAAYLAFHEAVVANPLAVQVPVMIAAIRFAKKDSALFAIDQTGIGMPIRVSDETRFRLLALTGGHPVAVFGILDEQYFHPMTIFTSHGIYSLSDR